jgi:DNA-binding transcriptional MerR regulator
VDLMGIGEFARLAGLSPKALRLYYELDLLVPARVDPENGYRWYSEEQLGPARLAGALRQLGMPLAQVRDVVAARPPAAAARIRAWWSAAECDLAARRQLAAYLVDQLNGKSPVMYEVDVREIPARHLLCLHRTAVDQDAVVALGKQFIAMLQDHQLPRLEDRAGAAFLIYHGEVSADSDGPVEWCKPVPAEQAAGLAAAVPDLTLRTEPAHQEAFVPLGRGPVSPAQWQLASQALHSWASSQHQMPSDLGVRVTFLATGPLTPASTPDCDFAVPLGGS